MFLLKMLSFINYLRRYCLLVKREDKTTKLLSALIYHNGTIARLLCQVEMWIWLTSMLTKRRIWIGKQKEMEFKYSLAFRFSVYIYLSCIPFCDCKKRHKEMVVQGQDNEVMTAQPEGRWNLELCWQWPSLQETSYTVVLILSCHICSFFLVMLLLTDMLLSSSIRMYNLLCR